MARHVFFSSLLLSYQGTTRSSSVRHRREKTRLNVEASLVWLVRRSPSWSGRAACVLGVTRGSLEGVPRSTRRVRVLLARRQAWPVSLKRCARQSLGPDRGSASVSGAAIYACPVERCQHLSVDFLVATAEELFDGRSRASLACRTADGPVPRVRSVHDDFTSRGLQRHR